MARTRKTWPTEVGEGRTAYPWPEWLDGRIWFLERGKDYTCSTSAMRSQYGMRANAAGLEYRTHAAGDGSGLYVQTTGRPDAVKASADMARLAYACPNCDAKVSAYTAREHGFECYQCRVPLEAA